LTEFVSRSGRMEMHMREWQAALLEVFRQPWAPLVLVALTALLVVLWLPGPVLVLVMAPLLAVLAATRPAAESLPAQQEGVLGRLSRVFAGAEEPPELLDALVLRVASHRERLFLGALGRWLEVPGAWRALLDLVPAAAAPARPSAAPCPETEAEAVRLRQQHDFSGAAAAFAKLELSDGGHLEVSSRSRQRYAQEAGHCWLEAGRPEAAIQSFGRAVALAPDLSTRRSALEAMVKAALRLGDMHEASTTIKRATDDLVRIAQVEPSEAHAAGSAAISAMHSAAEVHVAASHFEAAAVSWGKALQSGISAAEGLEACDVPWLQQLDSCFWRRYLSRALHHRGDGIAAAAEADQVLRQLPALVRGRGAACVLDIARAVEDSDLQGFEDASYELDIRCGPLASWQLDALLSLKARLASADLR